MVIAFGSTIGKAQSPSATITMPAKLPDASTQSELVENPVTFRLVQLALVETSLKLVDDAIQKAGGQANRDATKASNYEKNNELMDRKAGGPLAWDKFYGKTAEGFFYHPVDPNTTYHNPKPIAQRPPQLDYIYKANNDQIQKAKDDIAAMGGKLDKLTDRKHQLEKQQVALWGQISASMVAQRDLEEQPLYSFQLKIDGADADRSLAHRTEAIEAFAQFLRVVDKAATTSTIRCPLIKLGVKYAKAKCRNSTQNFGPRFGQFYFLRFSHSRANRTTERFVQAIDAGHRQRSRNPQRSTRGRRRGRRRTKAFFAQFAANRNDRFRR